MELILEKNYLRQLKVASLLLHQKTPLAVSDLSNEQQCSISTCLKDIEELSKKVPNAWDIMVEDGVIQLDSHEYENRSLIYETYFKEAISYQLVQNTLQKKWDSLQMCCDDIYVSRAHLYRKIKLLNTRLPDGVTYNPNTMSLEGDEQTIRILLYCCLIKTDEVRSWGISQDSANKASAILDVIRNHSKINFPHKIIRQLIVWTEICNRRKYQYPISDEPPFPYDLENLLDMTYLKNNLMDKLDTNMFEFNFFLQGLFTVAAAFQTDTHLMLENISEYGKKMEIQSQKLVDSLLVHSNQQQKEDLIFFCINSMSFFRAMKTMYRFGPYQLREPQNRMEEMDCNRIYKAVESNTNFVTKEDTLFFSKFLFTCLDGSIRQCLYNPVHVIFSSGLGLDYERTIQKQIQYKFEGLVIIDDEQINRKNTDLFITDMGSRLEKRRIGEIAGEILFLDSVPSERNWSTIEENILILLQKDSCCSISI